MSPASPPIAAVFARGNPVLRALGWILRLPGIVIHELAHAVAIVISPGVSIDEVHLTSHVTYQGQVGLFQAILISYSPLLVNSGITVGIALWVLPTAYPTTLGVHLVHAAAVAASVSVGFAGLPSVTDVVAPFSIYRQQFPGVRSLLALPVVVVYAVPALCILPLSWLRRRSRLLFYLSGGGFVCLLWGLAVYADTNNLGQQLASVLG